MGDSGGPLTVIEDGERKLIGNVSWGHSRCKKDGFPSGSRWNKVYFALKFIDLKDMTLINILFNDASLFT